MIPVRRLLLGAACGALLAAAPLQADGAAQAVFVADHDHVSIYELTGNYDRKLSNGDDVVSKNNRLELSVYFFF